MYHTACDTRVAEVQLLPGPPKLVAAIEALDKQTSGLSDWLPAPILPRQCVHSDRVSI